MSEDAVLSGVPGSASAFGFGSRFGVPRSTFRVSPLPQRREEHEPRRLNGEPGTTGSQRSSYRTASFNALPAVKRTTRRFGILMVAPVCGLRAVRALRWAVLKVPKPTKVIASPFLSDFVMPSISDSTAAAALDFDISVSLAILAISSCLFIE